jgi:hypothetical protein
MSRFPVSSAGRQTSIPFPAGPGGGVAHAAASGAPLRALRSCLWRRADAGVPSSPVVTSSFPSGLSRASLIGSPVGSDTVWDCLPGLTSQVRAAPSSLAVSAEETQRKAEIPPPVLAGASAPQPGHSRPLRGLHSSVNQ